VGNSDHPITLFTVRDIVCSPDSSLTTPERITALALASHMGTSGRAWPSLERLKGWTGLGMTAQRAALAKLCSGGDALFSREQGGARAGARYQPTVYRLAEGVATRAPQEMSPSSGELEGIASRHRGYRLATHKGSIEPINEPINQPTNGTGSRKPRKTRRTSSGPPPEAAAGARRFVHAFNHSFGRRVSVLPDLVQAFDARVQDGYRPEQLVALPILKAAQGLPDDLRKALQPSWLLRNGSHPRTRADGTTAGAKNWVSDTLGQADRTRLWPQHVEAARAAGVLATLLGLGARVVEGAE